MSRRQKNDDSETSISLEEAAYNEALIAKVIAGNEDYHAAISVLFPDPQPRPPDKFKAAQWLAARLGIDPDPYTFAEILEMAMQQKIAQTERALETQNVTAKTFLALAETFVAARLDAQKQQEEKAIETQIRLAVMAAKKVAEEMEKRPEVITPKWADGILSFRGETVKKFKMNPAINQRDLLDAFEAAGWPTTIQNPLQDAEGMISHRVLNETLRALNPTLKANSIAFEQDGNGGCRWIDKTLR